MKDDNTASLQAQLDTLRSAALEIGAYKAALLSGAEVPFNRTLRAYCERNVCGHYNENYACPPSVGEADILIAEAKGCAAVLVFQTVYDIEDSFDIEGMHAANIAHAEVSQKIFDAAEKLLGHSDFLRMAAGSCKLCKRCAKLIEEPCRLPQKRLTSLEAYCVDVGALAKKAGMSYINGQNTVTYFGMVGIKAI